MALHDPAPAFDTLIPYSVGATCFNLLSANNEAYVAVCNTFGELSSKGDFGVKQ